MSLKHTFSSNWKDLDYLLYYQSKNFIYRPDIIITELDGCLTKKASISSSYNIYNLNNFELFDNLYVKTLKKNIHNTNIIIVSNQFTNNKLLTDLLKRKIEWFESVTEIPVMVFFIFRNNKYSKPHTGIWKLIKSYYKANNCTINETVVVSNLGGRIIQTNNSHNSIRRDESDLDRAFAHNCKITYKTINEYLGLVKTEKFSWNITYLYPEVRSEYIERISEYNNPNIFKELANIQKQTCMIILIGAPKSGKTTFAEDIIEKWRASPYGKSNEIMRVGRDKFNTFSKMKIMAEKYLKDRISVIIDDRNYNDLSRKPYEDLAENYNTAVFYIEVNPGILMAQLFNRLAVENATNENVVVCPDKEYYIYRGKEKKPKNTLSYCPKINVTNQLLDFRY